MVIHFQYALLAGATVVCAVWLRGVTFLAEARGAGGLDGEGCHAGSGLGGEGLIAVAGVRGCCAGRGEDCGGVGPIEEGV